MGGEIGALGWALGVGEALASPLPQENGRMPVAFVGDVNSLLWNFIQPLFFTEFSY